MSAGEPLGYPNTVGLAATASCFHPLGPGWSQEVGKEPFYCAPNKNVNTSGLTPLGHAVLVESYEPEIKSSILAIPDTVRTGMQALEQRCTVIAVGPTAWDDEPARAKPGDKVLVTKYAGYVTNQTKDGKTYRVVNDRDVFCRIDWDQSEQKA